MMAGDFRNDDLASSALYELMVLLFVNPVVHHIHQRTRRQNHHHSGGHQRKSGNQHSHSRRQQNDQLTSKTSQSIVKRVSVSFFFFTKIHLLIVRLFQTWTIFHSSMPRISIWPVQRKKKKKKKHFEPGNEVGLFTIMCRHLLSSK